MKSFYMVSVGLSGGWYFDYEFTYGSFVELQRAMEYELWTDLRRGAQYVIWLDEMQLWTHIHGLDGTSIDLMPFVQIHDTEGEIYSRRDVESEWESDSGQVLERTEQEAGRTFLATCRTSIRWGEVPLIPLVDPCLQVGETAYFQSQEHLPQADRDFHVYGFRNLEGDEDDTTRFQEQIDQALALDPAWLTYRDGVVRGLAEKMHETGDYFAMTILADALQEAGCENELILWHCRSPAGAHARGSWLVEKILNPSLP